MTTEALIDELFDKLDMWRNLPAYQLERRADIFFAIYLKDILSNNINDFPIIDYIIPEFPVRKGNLKSIKDKPNSNLSFKVDYLAVSNISKKIFLVELKTENESFRQIQKDILMEVKSWSVSDLTESVIEIKKASRSAKYNTLTDKLTEMGWMDKNTQKSTNPEFEIHVVYIMPNDIKITDKRLHIISFKEVIKSIKHREDKLTLRFIESLDRWQ